MLKDHKEPLVISLTDIQLHSNESTNPQSFKRKIEKSVKSGKAERCYNTRVEMDGNKFRIAMDLPEDAQDRDIILTYPKEGVPIYLGKDSIEKIKSLKNKQII